MGDFKPLWIVPLATCAVAVIGVVVPYIIGASLGHIPAVLPFISDGGAYPPESCIFSFFQNVTACMLVLTIILRHMQLVEFYQHRRTDSWWNTLSIITMLIGFLIALGLSLVGNFSEMAEIDVHDIGAMMTFFSAIIYLALTSGLSFLTPCLCSLPIAVLRVAVTILAIVALAFHEITLQFNIFVTDKNATATVDDGAGYVPQFLEPDDPYYVNHIVATGSEWLLAFSIFGFFITFVEEFRKVRLRLPAIRFNSDHENIEGNKWSPYISED